MKISKIVLASAIAFASVGFIACGDSGSTDSGFTYSQSGIIQNIDEENHLITYEFDDSFCRYNDGKLEWVADKKVDAYHYILKEDTLILTFADEDDPDAYMYGDVFVGGGNSLYGTWDESRCELYDGEIECDEGESSYELRFEIGKSSITAKQRINPDFDYTSSYMVRDIFYALTENEEPYPEDWSSSKTYSDDYFDSNVEIKSNGLNSMDMTINGSTYKIRNANVFISNEKSEVKVDVSSNGVTCSLKDTYYRVIEDKCNAKYQDKLDIDDDEVYGYTETNVEEFRTCLYNLYLKNENIDLDKEPTNDYEEEQEINDEEAFCTLFPDYCDEKYYKKAKTKRERPHKIPPFKYSIFM